VINACILTQSVEGDGLKAHKSHSATDVFSIRDISRFPEGIIGQDAHTVKCEFAVQSVIFCLLRASGV